MIPGAEERLFHTIVPLYDMDFLVLLVSGLERITSPFKFRGLNLVGWLLLIIITIYLLLIGQKARNSSCDWFIQQSDNSCSITTYSPIIAFVVRLRKIVLNELVNQI